MTADEVRSPSAAGWDTVAAAYANRVEPFTATFAQPLLEMLGTVNSTTLLLDVACGAGAVALLAARVHGAQVTATDASPAMLNTLRSRSADSELVEVAVEDGQALPVRWHGLFDAVTSNFGVIFFDRS